MNYSDKIGYLKGLIDGLGIPADSNEGKVYAAIVSALEELVSAVSDLEDHAESVDDGMDELMESVADLEDVVYEDSDEEEEDDGEDVYFVKCPTCGEEIVLEEDMLDKPGIQCPACGEDLEFEFCDCDDCQDGDTNDHQD